MFIPAKCDNPAFHVRKNYFFILCIISITQITNIVIRFSKPGQHLVWMTAIIILFIIIHYSLLLIHDSIADSLIIKYSIYQRDPFVFHAYLQRSTSTATRSRKLVQPLTQMEIIVMPLILIRQEGWTSSLSSVTLKPTKTLASQGSVQQPVLQSNLFRCFSHGTLVFS